MQDIFGEGVESSGEHIVISVEGAFESMQNQLKQGLRLQIEDFVRFAVGRYFILSFHYGLNCF